jgi:arylsulfatase A-like enzyme
MVEEVRTRMGARLRALLAREDWIYLLSLLVPLFIYNVALKAIRVATQLDVPGPLGFVDQIRSELLFNLGYAALWIGLFAVARSNRARLVALGLFHASAMVVAVLTTAAHLFYKTTGSTLDYGLIVLSLSTFGEVKAVIASETTNVHVFLLSTVLFYGVAGPAVVTRLASGDWHLPLSTAGRPRAASAAFLAALALGILSMLPSATGPSNSFSRDALINIFVTELSAREPEEIDPEIETELAAEDLPTDARLVQTPETERRNVVIVLLESTRAESTTPYNEDLETTPFLADLAKKSVLWERAYAVVPHTSKALVATLCGVAPPLDTKNTESEPGIIPARCVADLLEYEGYRTAFFQSATEEFENRRELVENLGYEEFYPIEEMDKDGYETANYFGYEDDIMLEPSREWLEENGDRPFMATYLTVTPHHNYVVPDTYGTKEFAEDEEFNRYLNTIRYEDFFLKNLFEQYKETGVYEDTIFIVLSDHGEGFGEHGLRQHDNVIYNEGLHIPFLIHDPRRPEAKRIEAPINELDVLPTVADLLGYGIGGGTYPGMSALTPPPEDRVLMASCYQENTCLASIMDDEKYVYHYGNRPDEFFELSRDPEERENVADKHEAEVEARREELLAWRLKVDATYEQQAQGGETTASD